MNKLLLMGLLCVAATAWAQGEKPVITTDADIEAAVETELQGMTLEQKIGQMTQYDASFLGNGRDSSDRFSFNGAKLQRAMGTDKIGSMLNMMSGHGSTVAEWRGALKELQDSAAALVGSPILYGLDQVHGTTYSTGGTLFPQPIGMSATFNPELVRQIGEICAYETRACGVPWVFVPDLDLGRTPAWSRQYEGVGEDPLLGAEIGTAYMLGFQGPDPNHIDAFHVGTCLKHFFGYGVTQNGRDRVPGTASYQQLREKYFAPFLSAFRAGALSTMTNSSVLNGMNGVANQEYLTRWLKDELGWDGMIVTDWADIDNLHRRDRIAPTIKDAIVMVINAGVDMMMVPDKWDYPQMLKEAVEEGRVPKERIDDAARRVLRLKHRLGLYDNPLPEENLYPDFGSAKHRAVALQAALEGEVLLKNDDNLLPLKPGTKILVTGPTANSMRTLNGGWTYSWQGEYTDKAMEDYNTILEAMQKQFGDENVTFVEGVSFDPMPWHSEADSITNIEEAVAAATAADVIVACVGENSYAETAGNIENLHLSANQRELVRRLAATGKPVVLVLNQGRCRLIYDIEPLVGAVVDVMLPGNYGGDALALLLAGEENFSGRLPMTYPSQPHAFTTYDYPVTEVRDVMPGVYNYDAQTNSQWWFGDGLSYTTFGYENWSKCQNET